jgi:Zn-dependent protease with chaperone function
LQRDPASREGGVSKDGAWFGALVERLERSAARRPGAYRARVTALAVLGYAYLFAVLILAALATVIVVTRLHGIALKLAIPLLVVVGAVLKALWVTFPAPDGLPLDPHAAPRLFEAVRDVSRRLRGPRVHGILAVPELNAAITQTPHLGMFGWYRNHLLVGLPLLQAVSAEEWQAILAHEMGHLSRRHGRFGAWLYRARATWVRLLEALQSGDGYIGKAVFGWFATWYTPRFNAYAFVLARAHEYEADAAAAELVGRETARRALMRLEIAARQADGFWDRLSAAAVESPEPPADSQRQLRAALRSAPAGDEAARWVSAAWRRPTDDSDTHPAFADRLRALGWEGEGAGAPPPPEPLAGPSAAQVYLGDVEAAIEGEFDRLWAGHVRESWQQRHEALATQSRRLAELDAMGADLPLESEWERIMLCRILDEDRGFELSQRLLERSPDHIGARFYVGCSLLARGDTRGIEHLEQVMQRDYDTVPEACHALFDFHMARGEVEAAERYRERTRQWAETVEQAQAERALLTAQARFVPHDLDAAVIAAMQEQLRGHPGLKEAYIARRTVTILPGAPCYVVGIVPERTGWFQRNAKAEEELQAGVARALADGPELHVFLLLDALTPLRDSLAAIPGARLV